jgi:carboxymethylenebutenolidase
MLIRAALILALCAGLAVPSWADTATIMVGVNHKMRALLLRPDGPGPYPAILVLHTSGGLQEGDTDFAQRLVQQNYVALVPAFMEAYGITQRTRYSTFTEDAEPVYADLAAALETLRQEDKVKGSRLGAIGFSNGSYFAMWLAATAKVQAAVGYYGAYSGAGTDKSLGRFRQVFSKSSAPVLILHGGSDGTVPVQVAQNLADIIAAAQAPVQLQIYPAADHRFDREPGSPAAQAAASDAWARTLDFLAKTLRP